MGSSKPIRKLFKHKLVWDALLLISLVALAYSALNFKSVFSVLSVPVEANRHLVSQKADDLSAKWNVGPVSYRQAISYRFDRTTRDFLQGHYPSSYKQMLNSPHYQPYRWEVRQFSQGNSQEVRFFFTAKGEPYGFVEFLDPSAPGPALDKSDALSVARGAVNAQWGVDLGTYQLDRVSEKVFPTGRKDYRFFFTHKASVYKTHRYGITVSVSGDKLTQFQRRFVMDAAYKAAYKNRFSDNQVLTRIGQFIFWGFYLIGGCIVGISFLAKKRYLLWKRSLWLGAGVAFLVVLSKLNTLPLYWRTYDPVSSYDWFLMGFGLDLVKTFVFWAAVLSITLMAAESLTRIAFVNRIQLWKIATPSVASSMSVLGRVSGGYLLAFIYIGYVIFFHRNAMAWFDWSVRADMTLNPNILATYFPWLNPIVKSLKTSIWEECLFRAVPLSIASLIGKRFGHRWFWLGGALVLQALVFAISHAHYPGTPAYGVVAMLVLPAILFGFVYLSFGLVPVVLAHFLYNLILLSVPLFTTVGDVSMFNQIIIIGVAIFPLLYIGLCRLKQGQLNQIAHDALNKAWEPASKAIHHRLRPIEEMSHLRPVKVGILTVLAILGFIGFVFLMPFKSASPTVDIMRNDLPRVVSDHLSTHGIEMSADWQIVTRFRHGPSLIDQFVWDYGGQEVYNKLLGSYLSPPYWYVRVIDANYADQYQLSIGPSGNLLRLRRLNLPQDTSLLDPFSSRQLASRAVIDLHHAGPSHFRLISHRKSLNSLPMHWRYVFKDTRYPLSVGQARTVVKVVGDKVVDAFQLIHMPRFWVRSEGIKNQIKSQVFTTAMILRYVIVLMGFLFAVYSWSHHYFHRKAFYVFFGILLCLNTTLFLNELPQLLISLTAAAPIGLQWAKLLAKQGIWIVGQSLVFSVILGYIFHGPFRKLTTRLSHRMWVSFAMALLVMGVFSLYFLMVPNQLIWADYSALNGYFPLVAILLKPVQQYLSITCVIFMSVFILDRLDRLYHWRGWVKPFFVFIIGFILTLSLGYYSLGAGLFVSSIAAFLLAVLTRLFLRKHLLFVPLVGAILSMMGTIRLGALAPFSGAFFWYVVSGALVMVVGLGWYMLLVLHNRIKD